MNRTRVRYDRVGLLALALVVTLLAVLGGTGLLPTGGAPAVADTPRHPVVEHHQASPTTRPSTTHATGTAPAGRRHTPRATHRRTHAPATAPPPDPQTQPTGRAGQQAPGRGITTTSVPVPPASGSGRRIVFDQSQQRVWLVPGGDAVATSYLVSGSLFNNLHPGTYAVTNRERYATGIDNSGTMTYFVVFTAGQHAAIGFHSIPTKSGHLLQTRAQLGTPQSHGCIRQWLPDAIALWRFAPLGTKVVVVA